MTQTEPRQGKQACCGRAVVASARCSDHRSHGPNLPALELLPPSWGGSTARCGPHACAFTPREQRDQAIRTAPAEPRGRINLYPSKSFIYANFCLTHEACRIDASDQMDYYEPLLAFTPSVPAQETQECLLALLRRSGSDQTCLR